MPSNPPKNDQHINKKGRGLCPPTALNSTCLNDTSTHGQTPPTEKVKKAKIADGTHGVSIHFYYISQSFFVVCCYTKQIILKCQAFFYFYPLGRLKSGYNCDANIPIRIRAHPKRARAERTSPRIHQPPRAAKTVSRLMRIAAWAAGAFFWATNWRV